MIQKLNDLSYDQLFLKNEELKHSLPKKIKCVFFSNYEDNKEMREKRGGEGVWIKHVQHPPIRTQKSLVIHNTYPFSNQRHPPKDQTESEREREREGGSTFHNSILQFPLSFFYCPSSPSLSRLTSSIPFLSLCILGLGFF